MAKKRKRQLTKQEVSKRRESRKRSKRHQSDADRYAAIMRKRPTPAEKIVKDLLEREGIFFRFQKTFYSSDCAYIVDFYFKNVEGKRYVIEIDGKNHDYPAQKTYDKKRSLFLYVKRKCCVKRFTNEEVFQDPEGVLDKILKLSPQCIDDKICFF